jgi:hypothetical protein
VKVSRRTSVVVFANAIFVLSAFGSRAAVILNDQTQFVSTESASDSGLVVLVALLGLGLMIIALTWLLKYFLDKRCGRNCSPEDSEPACRDEEQATLDVEDVVNSLRLDAPCKRTNDGCTCGGTTR